jgi:hypothetical protein
MSAPFVLVPSDGVFGHVDLAASPTRLPHLEVCLLVLGGLRLPEYTALISFASISLHASCKLQDGMVASLDTLSQAGLVAAM